MAAAELAAWRIGTGIPAASTAATAASKRSSWQRREGVVGLVGDRAVGPHARRATGAARRATSSARRTIVVRARRRRGASRCRPSGGRRRDGPPARPSQPRRADQVGGVGGDRHAGGEGLVDVGRARLGQQQDRRGDARRRAAPSPRPPGPRPARRRRPRPRPAPPAPRRGRSRRPSPPRTPRRARTRRGASPRWPRPRRGTRPPTPGPSAGDLRRAPRAARSTRSDGHQPRSRDRARPGSSVEPRAGGGGLERRQPPGEEGADDAAEHVPGARRGEAGVARR